MPIVMCVCCNGTGWKRKPQRSGLMGVFNPHADIGEPCPFCKGKGGKLQDSCSFPCGGIATEGELKEARRRGLRRV